MPKFEAAKHHCFAASFRGLKPHLAEMVGFEPTCRLITDKTISSRSRYDHFDTSPYLVVFEFCTAFARPMVKCCHPKFKKNEAFARKSKKTRAFAHSQVTRSSTFRVIGSCFATHVMTTSLSPRRRRYLSVLS